MNKSLLDQILAEECIPYVRGLLNSALEAVKTGTAPAKNRFEFDRFEVTIDAEKNEVVLEDVLDATDAGKQTVALQELEKGLQRLAEAQSS
jgi:hypothetical protein